MHASLQPVRTIRLKLRCALVSSAIALLTLLSPPCFGQSKTAFTPNDLEAAYLYNFGKFVQWPAAPGTASQPFSICILGQDEFGSRLDDLVAKEDIAGRKIVTRRLASADTAENCQIVFIGNSEDARLSKDLDALNKKPLLTVSSLPQFLDHGGMIQFILQDNHVRFAVNLAAAQTAGLSPGSELLKVAVYVKRNPPAEAKP